MTKSRNDAYSGRITKTAYLLRMLKQFETINNNGNVMAETSNMDA